MATSGSKTGSAGWGGLYVRAEWARTSVNATNNTSTVRVRLYLIVPSGWWVEANESGSITLDGSTNSFSRGNTYRGPGTHQLHEFTRTLSHNSQGNKTFSYSGSFTSAYAPLGTITTGAGSGVLDRIAKAPTIGSVTVSNIKQKQATITTVVSNMGHGTSVTVHTNYRKVGSGTWIEAGTTNPITITGLEPNTSYEYGAMVINNNGDFATYVSPTPFKTKPVVGFIPLLARL